MIVCCYNMERYLSDKVIKYSAQFRMYFLKISKSTIQGISYCPWCGVKLPESLYNKIFDVASDALGYEVTGEDLRNLPQEFQTDEWWKKRNL